MVNKKTIITPIISLVVTLLLISTGLSFAYFSINFSGIESDTTISASGGIMHIAYDGGADVEAFNIEPSNDPFGTKTFTVT